MTSRSSSRCVRSRASSLGALTAAAFVAVIGSLAGARAQADEWDPFGPAATLVAKHNPWSGFQSKDAILMVLRAEKHEGQACAPWAAALAAETPGTRLGHPPTPETWLAAWKHWEPWNEDDRESVSECKKFPCGVKVNAVEGKALNAASPDERFAKFLKIVQARSEAYLKTQARPEYEFPGDPVDPWKLLAAVGIRPALAPPGVPDLYAKRVELAKGELHVIHQIVDFRHALNAGGTESAVWERDAYVDHYFDGWGEFGEVLCGADGKSPIVLQALILEFDLLKKTDLVSVISRGTMKSGIEKHGKLYLENWHSRVQKRVERPKT